MCVRAICFGICIFVSGRLIELKMLCQKMFHFSLAPFLTWLHSCFLLASLALTASSSASLCTA